jgi:hypothetical protein
MRVVVVIDTVRFGAREREVVAKRAHRPETQRT